MTINKSRLAKLEALIRARADKATKLLWSSGPQDAERIAQAAEELEAAGFKVLVVSWNWGFSK